MKKKTKLIIGILSGFFLLAALAVGIYIGMASDLIYKEKEQEANLADIEWYDEQAKEFTITTEQELYDFALLSEYYSFEGQTVKLGADIVVNEGNAADWDNEAPERKWWPIVNFAGTFDGQGHTVSGLYGYGADYAMGFFANSKPKAIFKDFRLENSYFFSSYESVGSISANGSGTYTNIYTNAIVGSDNLYGTGGFIGKVDSAGESVAVGYYTRFTNCWFEGKVCMFGMHGANSGGFVGKLASGTLEIKNCMSSGEMELSGTQRRAPDMGGFVGRATADIGTVILNMEGCLADTKITTPNTNVTGSVIGRVGTNCVATFKDSYATIECFDGDAIRNEKEYTGTVLRFSEKTLKGNGGYEWTNLDFEKYWSIQQDGIPVLTYFADNTLPTEGLKKAFNIDWYDEYASELIIDSNEDFFGFFLLPYMKGVTYQGQTVKLACDVKLNDGDASKWGEEAPTLSWLPVGAYPTPFAGTFDGQGHTVSGLYVNTTTNYTGMFGRTAQGSMVKNFKLVNSYFKGGTIVGSVIGRSLGDIENVYSNAIVVATSRDVGGIVGQTLETTNPPLTIKISNCWFDGELHTITENSFSYAGGILGDNRNNHVTIEHCLFTGKITSASTRYNPIVGGISASATNPGAVTIINDCLSTGTISAPNSQIKGLIGSILGTSVDSNTKVTNSYATKECWEKATTNINGAASISGQYDEETLIGLGGYQWTTLDFDKYWAVVTNDTPILKSYAKKVPSVAGVKRMLAVDWFDESKDVYVLDSAADLMGFQMLAGTNNFKGKTVKLGADIVLNTGDASKWADKAPETIMTGIGSHANRFAGVFDGQGHSISGLYMKGTTMVGMFISVAEGGVVKNFRLENSYIEGKHVVGSVVGRLYGNLEGVYSDAIVVAESNVGGIVGECLDPTDTSLNISIKNSQFDGTVHALTLDGCSYAGGILGDNRNNKVTIEHCLFTGTIISDSMRFSPYIGGINGVSMNANAVTVIKDCFSNGTITLNNSAGKNTVASLLGYSKNPNSKIVDSYGTTECSAYATSYIAGVGSTQGQYEERHLLGVGGYELTTLDFDKYWVAIENKTPELKKFSDGKVCDLSGAVRPETSWYDNQKGKTYVLKTVEQFVGFQHLAQIYDFAGQTIKLGDEIGDVADLSGIVWTPIGNTGKPFAGTFDGNGKTIKNLDIQVGTMNVGMFGVIGESGVVKNFRLVDSSIESTYADRTNIGSIAGQCEGTLKDIYSEADVICAQHVAGGLVGVMTGNNPKISSCWFAGSVSLTSKTSKIGGGLVATALQAKNARIEHCLFTGELYSAVEYNNNQGEIIGGICAEIDQNSKLYIVDTLSDGHISTKRYETRGDYRAVSATFAQCYQRVDNNDANSTALSEVIFEGAVYATKECFANLGNMANAGWNCVQGSATQMARNNLLGVDGYIQTQLDFDKYWVAIENGTPELKKFAVGTICDISNAVRPDTSWYDNQEGKTYVLTTVDQLVGFQQLAQTYNFAGQTIKLGDEIEDTIDLNEIVWTPIGSAGKPFAGTFNGNGKTIKNLEIKMGAMNVGMFGVIGATGVVKNFRLIESHIESSFAGRTNIGSIAGQCLGTIKDVYSKADVVCAYYVAGGLVGVMTGSSPKISNCWFDGTVRLNSTDSKLGGGLVATTLQATQARIEHCLFTGSLYSAVEYNGNQSELIGGICAEVDQNSKLYISDTLSAGSISTKRYETRGDYRTVSATFAQCYQRVTQGNGSTAALSEVIFENGVYATKECFVNLGNMANGDWNCVQGSATQIARQHLLGVNGYIQTKLDFTNYWVAIVNGTPELKKFAKGTVCDLTGVVRPDASWYDNQAGKTYVLTTVDQLVGFQQLAQTYNFAGQTIQLGDAMPDIVDLKDVVWTPIGSAGKPFAGVFDGNGKTIKNLEISVGTMNVGMFGVIGATGVVQDFRLINSRIESSFAGRTNIGSIAGQCLGTIKDVYSKADVVCAYYVAGGLVGVMTGSNPKISNCWFDGTVRLNSSDSKLGGGLVATALQATQARIEHCLFTGSLYSAVQYNNNQSELIGGICAEVGQNSRLYISDTLSAGTISTKRYETRGDYRTVSATFAQCYQRVVEGNGSTAALSEVIFESGVYASKDCFKNLGNMTNGDWNCVQGSVIEFTTAMKGSIGQLNSNYWTAIANDTPILSTFSTTTVNVSVFAKLANTVQSCIAKIIKLF